MGSHTSIAQYVEIARKQDGSSNQHLHDNIIAMEEMLASNST